MSIVLPVHFRFGPVPVEVEHIGGWMAAATDLGVGDALIFSQESRKVHFQLAEHPGLFHIFVNLKPETQCILNFAEKFGRLFNHVPIGIGDRIVFAEPVSRWAIEIEEMKNAVSLANAISEGDTLLLKEVLGFKDESEEEIDKQSRRVLETVIHGQLKRGSSIGIMINHQSGDLSIETILDDFRTALWFQFSRALLGLDKDD